MIKFLKNKNIKNAILFLIGMIAYILIYINNFYSMANNAVFALFMIWGLSGVFYWTMKYKKEKINNS
jgi:uncharacterized membrane protein